MLTGSRGCCHQSIPVEDAPSSRDVVLSSRRYQPRLLTGSGGRVANNALALAMPPVTFSWPDHRTDAAGHSNDTRRVGRGFGGGGGRVATAVRAATCRDSEDKEWIYPYVWWWRPSRVNALARVHGLEVQRRRDLREAVVGKSPADGHDWVTVVRSELREQR